MKYLTTVVAACLLLAACGDSQDDRPVPSRSVDRSAIELLNRPSNGNDRLPSDAERLLARTVILDRHSVRQAGTLAGGVTIWAFKGTRSGAAGLGVGEVTCLAVLDRLERVLADRCSAEAELVDPKRSVVILSGGAAGSPGMRPREVLVVGLLGVDVSKPSLLADGGQLRGGNGGVYWLTSRATVTGATYLVKGGGRIEMRFDPCQAC